ncbi:unnamed protein product [Calypogeia fissa]
MARSYPFAAIIFLLWVTVWTILELRTSLAKECTNVPTQTHTARGSLFEDKKLGTDISSWYRRIPLSSRSVATLSAASFRNEMADGPFGDYFKTSVLAEDLLRAENLEDHHPAGADVSNFHLNARHNISRGAELFESFFQRRKSIDRKNSFKVSEDGTHSVNVGASLLTRRASGFAQSPLLKEVPLHRVTLASDSLHGIAQETNLQYLLMLDVDSLVWNFRVTAGLPAPGSPYGGWEYPNMELRGHFIGHYLSATALTWASTQNEALLSKMTQIVDALQQCQDHMGTGYLSAFPDEFFDRFEAIRPVWAPYYTIHKIMAGLLDQYVLVGSEKSLGMLLWMAEYFLRRVENVIHKHTIERHWESLNEEVGGMNDIMYRHFMLTGDPDHLKLAHLFDKPCFLGLLAVQTDGLSGFHSNTHIPLVVGAQMRFEATGDKLYAELSQYFMDIVNTSHRYATGGTSVSEFWTYPNRNGDALGTENQETCTTYNMLKVARNMFRWTKDISYADYFERTLVNGILGIQRGKQPGVMIYMLPQAPGTSKAVSYHGWGTPYDAFWCCYGTGIESFSKLGDSIYFEDYNTNLITLHITQYVSSNLSWDAMGLLLSQTVIPLSSYDPYLHVTFEFYDLPQQGKYRHQGELSLRIPSWTMGATSLVNLNGLSLGAPRPGHYFSIKREWTAGDVLQVHLHISLALERIQDDRQHFSSLHAILFGPYLLAGMTNRDFEINGVNTSSLSSWIVPVPQSHSAQLYTFSQDWSADSFSETLKGSEAQTTGGWTSVLSYGSTLASMKSVPPEGTNEAAQATFLLINLSAETPKDPLMDRLVSLELFSQPGRVLAHTGVNEHLVAVDKETRQPSSTSSSERSNSESLQADKELESASYAIGRSQDGQKVFKIRSGLSGEKNTISFEVATMAGCFVASDLDNGIKIQCQPKAEGRDPHFDKTASFKVNKGLATHNPMSFIAKGMNRQFLLVPLYAYLDETYTTYFNLTSA